MVAGGRNDRHPVLQLVHVDELVAGEADFLASVEIKVVDGRFDIRPRLADRLVDKLILFIGPKLFGHGIKSFTRLAVDRLSDAKILSINHVEMIGEDIMVEGYFA